MKTNGECNIEYFMKHQCNGCKLAGKCEENHKSDEDTKKNDNYVKKLVKSIGKEAQR